MKRKHLQSAVVLLLGLAIITAYYFLRPKPNYELQTVATPTGWGYQVMLDGEPVIDQPTIPGQAGHRSFVSEEQARRVGQRVMSKLRLGQFPPTLTPRELAELGVPIQH
ncbi:DUF4907 domain-containing protein [Larkinella sp. VNQ87]|uniref:DUF4907 domain-containing protein n=1 Tax=Larkinella sp. VNQ87 TaxID=3400921 RepID=UPI003C0B71E4